MNDPFRVLVVGLGVQGTKRLRAAGDDAVATVDPVNENADFRRIEEVPPGDFDAAIVCVPDDAKTDLLYRLLGMGKHVLVEKPLMAETGETLKHMRTLAVENKVVCYTAYNHRFEPHFIRMREVLTSGVLGRIYRLRMFYGNGTARLVRDSAWRDRGGGVLFDLGSHLLDTVDFWLGNDRGEFRVVAANRHENKAFDHVILVADGTPGIELEMTLLSWRNHYTADVFGAEGSAHISSLCKWGPSTFTLRKRVLPSGRPDEDVETLEQDDPTWQAEYAYFKQLCRNGGTGNTDNDIRLNDQLRRLDDDARKAACR